MSGQDWTTTELLTQVKDIGRIPDDDPDATNAKILAEANRQLETVFVPLVRKARAEYYTTHYDYTLVQGQDAYRIPPRSTSSTVRTVLWINSANIEIELPPVPITDRHLYKPQKGFPCVYGVHDDEIVVMPTPNSSNLGRLRVAFERRPSKLVEATTANYTAVTQAGAVDSSYVTTFKVNPAAPMDLSGGLVDVVGKDPPFSLKVMDGSIASITLAGLITLAADSAARAPLLGDYVTFPGETIVAQIPAELHPLLALATAAKLLRPIDAETAAVLAADLAAGLEEAKALLQPRQQGRQMKLKSTSSVMRRSGRRRGAFGDWRP